MVRPHRDLTDVNWELADGAPDDCYDITNAGLVLSTGAIGATAMKHWISSYPVSRPQDCADFAMFLQLSPERHAIAVGDVAGRGPLAGETARNLRAHLHDLLVGSVTVGMALRTLSGAFARAMVCDATPSASLFVAVVDTHKRMMRYVSAGHEPGLLFRGDGTHQHLEPTGSALGVGAIPAFPERLVALDPQDVIVVVTDGVTEARRDEGDALGFFGSAGVVRAVHSALREGRDPARAICQAALDHAHGHLADDASAVVSRLLWVPVVQAAATVPSLQRQG